MKTTQRPHHYRAIWISDVHLGTRECRAEFLLDFLQSTECDQLYLVGDLIDLWNMKRQVHWPQSHSDVVRTILRKAHAGTEVIYIPGNHDEAFREFCGFTFGNLRIAREAIHLTADNRRFLVLHGDEFDDAVKCGRLLSAIGNVAYDLVLRLSHRVHSLRRRLGLPYWSLVAFLKRNVNQAAKYIEQFDHAVAHEAARREVDGLICGHIHRAQVMNVGERVYCNDGDWVESCTALVEHADGALELVHWSDRQHSVIHLPPLVTEETPEPVAA